MQIKVKEREGELRVIRRRRSNKVVKKEMLWGKYIHISQGA